MKRCRKCGEEKPLKEFVKDKRRKDGCAARCLACSRAACREATRRYRKRHPTRDRETYYRNVELTRKQKREAAKRRRHANPERTRAEARAYKARDPAKWREYARRWREANRETIRKRVTAWRLANPERYREYKHRRRVLIGTYSKDTVDYVEALLKEPCSYCGSDENVELDHIIPLSRGGKHEPPNLTSACRQCNRSKGAKLLSEWLGPPT